MAIMAPNGAAAVATNAVPRPAVYASTPMAAGPNTLPTATPMSVAVKPSDPCSGKGPPTSGHLRKAPNGDGGHPIDARINRIIAMVRAKGWHPLRVLKRQFGRLKTGYLGLVKNRAQLVMLFAPGNQFLMRRRLMALEQVCPKSGIRPLQRAQKGRNSRRVPSPARQGAQGTISAQVNALIRRFLSSRIPSQS